jgi:hypothetical protein
MTSRGITFAVFAVLGLALAAWAIFAAMTPRIVTFPALIARLSRGRAARLVIVAGWAWVGWHLFARGSGAFE